jgi:hypothetical protein
MVSVSRQRPSGTANRPQELTAAPDVAELVAAGDRLRELATPLTSG